jgi:hypothetical protein
MNAEFVEVTAALAVAVMARVAFMMHVVFVLEIIPPACVSNITDSIPATWNITSYITIYIEYPKE